ncbi:MAG: YggT family protein [Actinomycetota bacterium]|nr:YggT family protein [Actinomycetota bacterium]
MELVCAALSVFWLLLLVRVILSWVTMAGSPPSSMGGFTKVIYDLTEPVLGFFRRIIPPMGPLDLSALIVFLLLGVVRSALGCGGIL